MIEKLKNFDKKDKEFVNKVNGFKKLTNDFSDTRKKRLTTDTVVGETILPEKVTFVDILKRNFTNDKNEKTEYLTFITDKDVEYSLSRIFDIAFLGKESNIKFKGSRKTSQLLGAGVLSNAESINKDILNFASKNGLSQLETATALLGVELIAKEIEAITYFPVLADGETYESERFQADYLNSLKAQDKDIEGLKIGKKYQLSFASE